MAQFVEVPADALAPDTLQGLLEEFASRDGTDYGLRETPLENRTSELQRRLQKGEACLLFHSDTESWDILPREQALQLLAEEDTEGHGDDG